VADPHHAAGSGYGTFSFDPMTNVVETHSSACACQGWTNHLDRELIQTVARCWAYRIGRIEVAAGPAALASMPVAGGAACSVLLFLGPVSLDWGLAPKLCGLTQNSFEAPAIRADLDRDIAGFAPPPNARAVALLIDA